MIYRIDVRTAEAASGGQAASDPFGTAIGQQIAEFGSSIGPIRTTRVFFLDTEADRGQVGRIASGLLADPIVEQAVLFDSAKGLPTGTRIEIHLKPGVMDPVASSTEMAIRDMGISVREVRTGRSFLIEGEVPRKELQRIASRVLANGVIESVHFDAFLPTRFETGREHPFQLRHVSVRELTDEGLKKLSRDGHLFLSLEEMQAIQTYFREQKREPTDIELETLAQTWSEHCVHKTLKSAVDVQVKDAGGKTTSTRRYSNLIKETIFQSTMDLMSAEKKRGGEAFCLSVFKDNAGVVSFDETDAVCFKVETHNHPSAIEPYGGSATGVGGCIRDVMGTGLSARPVANTDAFCVAFPDYAASIPNGVIHPKRILQQVVAGVRDYGNRMGIPTVNGAVYFDDRYLGNPLVFCGCVGLLPKDKIEKAARKGDAIVVMGGRTGRDGIHGATFSSAELTDTHADEFSHAVQIGNAITQKKVADVILAARDQGLFTGVTDCGAGGLSSAIGEMGEKTGATVDLHLVPLKYAGLKYDEIWISEAQERMVLAVPGEKVAALLELAGSEDVEATVIGTFGTPEETLILRYGETTVGRIAMEFLHDGIPMPTRTAVVTDAAPPGAYQLATQGDFCSRLLELLAHPTIASKHWIIRQYDHEVQGGSVIKPLIGPLQIGPSDAAVVRPKLNSFKGVALSNGLCPQISDPYYMAIAAIDEAVRNAVAVGADPSKMAILDNFCWPSVADEITMGTLVRACEACRDAAIAFAIPFISGKDSLHNQFTNQETGQVIRIPNTLLISAIAVLDDVRKCVTMDLKMPGRRVCLISTPNPWDLASLIATHRAVASLISRGLVASCHDVSDGGVACAAAEMCIASGLGLAVTAKDLAFSELPGQYLVELRDPEHNAASLRSLVPGTTSVTDIAITLEGKKLTFDGNSEISIDDLTRAWRGTLDW